RQLPLPDLEPLSRLYSVPARGLRLRPLASPARRSAAVGARSALAALLSERAVHRHGLRASATRPAVPVLVRRGHDCRLCMARRAARLRVALPDANGREAVARRRRRLDLRGLRHRPRLARDLSREVPAAEQLGRARASERPAADPAYRRP